jgi:putative SOS response-associated peptidase YedK
MCGRYVRKSDKQRIVEAFHAGNLPPDFVLSPDYNIAPSTHQPVIRESAEDGEREVVLMQWGLVPSSAISLAQYKTYSTINARSENLLKSGLWRKPFSSQRCLVPVDAFYEWVKEPSAPQPALPEQSDDLTLGLFPDDAPRATKRAGKGAPAGKKPVFAFRVRNSEPFAFAGIWDRWHNHSAPRESPPLESFSIVTTEANELMTTVHNRMPVILKPRDYGLWLTRETFGAKDGLRDIRELQVLLRPFDSDAMEMTPANQLVGNVRNNGPEMLNSA